MCATALSTTKKTTNPRFAKLQPPRILFQNNHILAVHKPPGWQSVLDQELNHPKCLMQYLQRQNLGGGSNGQYLKPIHRLDQPCSGVLLYAKTTKAASRIQSNWNAEVHKTYHVVVETRSLPSSWNQHKAEFRVLRADMPVRRKFNQRSVCLVPNSTGAYEISTAVVASNAQYAVLQVHTQQGARHMIRAILAAYGMPLAGDLRYGGDPVRASNKNNNNRALADQSVALHCTRLELDIALGSEASFDIMAPLPATWGPYFGFSSRVLSKLSSSSSSSKRNKV